MDTALRLVDEGSIPLQSNDTVPKSVRRKPIENPIPSRPKINPLQIIMNGLKSTDWHDLVYRGAMNLDPNAKPAIVPNIMTGLLSRGKPMTKGSPCLDMKSEKGFRRSILILNRWQILFFWWMSDFQSMTINDGKQSNRPPGTTGWLQWMMTMQYTTTRWWWRWLMASFTS